MGIVITLLVGLVVGAVARLLIDNRDSGGVLITMLIGASGALLALFVGIASGWFQSPTESDGIIVSMIGAMLLLVGYRAVIGGRQPITRHFS